MKLLLTALLKFLSGAVLVGALLFLPAGTLAWPRGWLLMAVLFLPMLLLGLVLLFRCPDLLRSRLEAREDRQAQKTVLFLSSLMFTAGFLLAGFNFRWSWWVLPAWVSRTAAAVFLISYGLYAEVLRENAWLSRTVRVRAGQRVVDTGLYAHVRHPMYAVTLPLFLCMPLILGSPWSFLVFLLHPVLLVRRIQNEEQLLRAELPGYAAYCERVRSRLIPGIW